MLQFKVQYDSLLSVPPRIHHTRARRRGRRDYHSSCGRILYESLMSLHPLVSAYPLVSDQVSQLEVSIILNQLDGLLKKSMRGAVVEFGCYEGTTSLFLRRLLDTFHHEGPLHVYDSFEGLPEKTGSDMSAAGEQFRAGELFASKKQLLRHFHRANLVPPVIHKAWFNLLTPSDIPDGIMYAFLDGDYYESIRDSLRLITPKLLPGAVIIVDDYANEALPGAHRAVEEWCQGRTVKVRVEASLAIITT